RGLTRQQYPWHDQAGGTVHAFRLLRNSTTKATDHELQKYDIFTRYGQAMICHLAFPDIAPYTAGEDDASSWRRQIAFLITASAWGFRNRGSLPACGIDRLKVLPRALKSRKTRN
ncbi:hypothetical protein, partial [Bradyrhizobium sp.]|uniref:hypothetical protein n=1 Tax=Bradyrhizobium sp. TaxID=376 RepID=UPI002623A764